ncbi:MAG TPA: hypothetical protein VGW12_21495 [Pyrinomonadaceae bacterium]|nr:hypothetical protein [Pyrinomonadaceae bacterium]
MPTSTPPRTRKLTIIAQDPSVRANRRILRARVEVPAEDLAPGPWGYRVHVVDYDSSTGTLYRPLKYRPLKSETDGDIFANASDEELLSNPNFHAQNVYAIVMRTLARFEFALGRRVSWGFYGHQIKVAPHAFADANAFYSERDQALMFGYFPGRKGRMVWSCLSHDVVAHEATHALLDGLRERYTDPSSPEQAGFHEGFADIVALLSVFSLPDIVGILIDLDSPEKRPRQIARKTLTIENMRDSMLLGLAKEMGQELPTVRGDALRRSAKLTPSRDYIKSREFAEPHRRGEILVAAVMNAFLSVWQQRLSALGDVAPGYLDRGRVVEEGATAADYLLTMVIRALDYAPPVNLEFCDFLSAILTSDREINPVDAKYNFRDTLRKSFISYGIDPASKGTESDPGIWEPPQSNLNYTRTHFESMQRDPDEVFRFIWDNRKALSLYDDAYSRVLSVRPCLRIGPDGFALRETVAEYMQIINLQASELKILQIKVPEGMPKDQEVRLYGGGALIFDEYGRLKYHVRTRVNDRERQTQRLKFLWEYGYFRDGATAFRSFSNLHRQRAMALSNNISEEW